MVAVCGLAAVSLAGFMACSHPGGHGPTTGSAGTTGAAGATSPTGTAGTGSGNAGTGVSGIAGTTGAAGDTGTPGTAGNVGTPGDAGTTGSAGNVGTPGDAGTTGSAGSGAAGTTGGGGGTTGTTGGGGNGGNVGATGTGGSGSGPNLIANGDFSSGATNWHTEMGTGNVNGSGAYCVSNPGSALIGYDAPSGSPLMLMGGRSYRISYQASGAGALHLKVGMSAQPFGDIYTADDNLGNGLQTFTHNFMPTASNSAGLAFTFSNAGSATVCIDNVAISEN